MASDRSPGPLAGVICRRDFGSDGEETGKGRVKLTGFRVGELKLLSLFGWGIRVFGLWGPGFGCERVLVKLSGFWGCWLIPSEGTGWSFRSNQGGSRELLKLDNFRLQSDIS